MVDAGDVAMLRQVLIHEIGPALANCGDLGTRGAQSLLGAVGVLELDVGLRRQARRGHCSRGREQVRVVIAGVAGAVWCVHGQVHGAAVAVGEFVSKRADEF